MQLLWSHVLISIICLFMQSLLVHGRVFTVPGKRLVHPNVAMKATPSLNKLTNKETETTTAAASPSWRNKLSRKQLIVPIAGSMAASVAELVTFPLDVAKVNMQVSRGKHKQEVGIIDLLSSIVAVNGFFGLWRGFPAALLRQIFYQVLKVVLFEPLTALLVLLTGAHTLAVTHMLLGGGLAGTLGAFLTTPFDRVKVRTQILGSKEAESTAKGLGEIFEAVTHLDIPHIRTLYTGASASCQRAFLLNAAELTSYSVVKRTLIRQNSSLLRYNNTMDNVYTHLVSALCSGFIASAVSAPIDRAKTLIISSPHTYSGMTDCLSDVFINQGLVGLYKGFFATWLRLAPFTILFFLSFEYFKMLLRSII
jgi:hypothetical protein